MFKNILQNKLKKSSLGIENIKEGVSKTSSSNFLLHQSNQYLSKLQEQLDVQLDKRLVRTFFDLLMSELGGIFVVLLKHQQGQNGLVIYYEARNGHLVL